MMDLNKSMADIPSSAEEGWRIVDEGDRWTLWFVPLNHPVRWREWATFATEPEAVEYLKTV